MPDNIQTNFKDNNGVDLGSKLITKDYLISVYPGIVENLGISPELWTWGYGSNFILGTGDTLGRSTPVTTFTGGFRWKQISSSKYLTAAIKTDGTLWIWGNGVYGQLGNADITSRSTPITTFAGGTDWKQVSCGWNHTSAIKTDGTLWVWGSNIIGRLGTGIGDNYDPNNVVVSNISTPVTTFVGGTNWRQVSASRFATAAIKTDGTLWTWGTRDQSLRAILGHEKIIETISTPITTFAGGTNWADTPDITAENLYTLSASYEQSSAIKTDGTLWVWGETNSGALGNGVTSLSAVSTPITTFAGGNNWKQITNESLYRVAIKTDGTLWTWGNGSSGRLGNANTTNISTPITTFAGGTNWKQVSSGFSHTVAIKNDGTLWMWGNGGSGQLGNGVTTGSISTPVTTFAGGNNWKHANCGTDHTGAIKTDGTLWTWGSNAKGQLGNATISDSSTPVTTFVGGTNWKQVSFRYKVSAAIKTDGTLWTWGDQNYGRLGCAGYVGTFPISTPITTFAGGTNWKQVSVGWESTSAIKTDGTLWIWGAYFAAQLGIPSPGFIYRSTPITTFAGGTNWKQVASGEKHIIALNGTKIYAWGAGGRGQLGNATISDSSTPVTTFAGGTNWADVDHSEDLYTIAASRFHAAAIKTDGTLWTWGNNTTGQLGNNKVELVLSSPGSTPSTTFAGGTNWKQVASNSHESSFYTLATKSDGTLWAWGQNKSGQLGFPTNYISTPITTFAGGNNWADSFVDPGDLYTISSHRYRSAVIKTDGTLWTWGAASDGALGNAVTTNTSVSTPITTFAGGTNWKQVSVGDSFASGIKTDGTLWTWGVGSFGILGNAITTGNRSTPVTTFAGGTNWKQVSCGYRHIAAIKTDGTLWTWGWTYTGRLGNNFDGFSIGRSTPVTTFAGGTDWKQVSAGGHGTAAIKTDGTLWIWGSALSGRLGNTFVTTATNALTPITTFAGGTDWKQVSVGKTNNSVTLPTAAIKTDGTLWIWGNGANGLLGNGVTTTTNVSTPITTFAGGTNWGQVNLGEFSVTAVKTDGTLWTWGTNYSGGALGNASTSIAFTPITTFIGGTDWKQVNGGYSGIALRSDGTLWAWGNNLFGTLGNASITDRSTPVTTFAGGTNWADAPITPINAEDLYTLSAGTNSVGAIKTDGTLWTWGDNSSGSLGGAEVSPTISNKSTPITTFSGGTNWKQVATGGAHMSAIKTDGTLWVWGFAGGGRLGNTDPNSLRSTPVTTFIGGSDWRQTSAGVSNIVAIKTDGTLWTWGTAINGQLGNGATILIVSTPVTTFAGGTDWKQSSFGGDSAAAIKTDGTLWTWGLATFGRLGDGTTVGSSRSTPITTFAGGTNWKQVSVGNQHTAAVKTDGTLWVWGNSGVDGRLGNANTLSASTPITTFAGGTNWKQVTCGGTHTAAVKTDGTLWVWGNGGNGRLGNAVTTDVSTPVTTFIGGTNWKQVTAGANANFTAALIDDGFNKRVWLFGDNSANQLGNFITTIVSPRKVSNDLNWKQVSAGNLFSAAIKTDGTLWTWGDNYLGSLGNRFTGTTRSTPITTFAGGTDWRQISCGYRHVSAIKTDGTLWIWGGGGNASGALGNAIVSNRSTPVTTFAGGTDWKQVSCGGFVTAAIKTDGTLWTWGNNLSGTLGNATNFNIVSTPVTTFAGGTDWKQVAAGSRHMAAVKTDGTLWMWGYNGYGELGSNIYVGYGQASVSTPTTTFAGGNNWSQVFCPQYRITGTPYTTASEYTIAIKTDGTLWTWGRNATSELGMFNNLYVPVRQSDATDWKQVSMGSIHASAVKNDGTLWTWGSNENKALGDPNMSSGYYTYGYIAADPRVRFTPITTFAGGTNWKQVSSNLNHTAAVKTDGTLWMWGNNNYGQLGRALEGIGKVFRGNIQFPLEVNPGENWNDTQIINLEDLSTISVHDTMYNEGSNSFAAIKKNGTLWVWGGGGYGQLGNALRLGSQANTPSTTFAGGTNWKKIDCTYGNCAAIKTDGTLWVWGNNYNGELGINALGTRSTPVTTFAGGTNWNQVSIGYGIMGAVKTDGTLWTWGNNDDNFSFNGILGRYSINYFGAIASTPITTFAGGNNWADTPTTNAEDLYTLSAGGVGNNYYAGPNSVAIKTDGTLWTWGYSNAKIHPSPLRYIERNYNQLGVDGICDENGRLPGTLSFNSDPYTGKRITTTSGSGTVTPITNNLLGPASLVVDETLQPTFGGVDDGFWVLTLPFDISFNGKTYRTVFPTTNHFITFGEGHRGLSLNVENPSLPKIMISATDGSVQRLCYGTEGTAPNRTYRIRCEGTYMISSSDLNNPNMVYEITFYENVPNQIDIQIGENQNKILDVGPQETANYISIPTTTFAGGTNWKQVSAGSDHAAAVKTDGTLWVWGGTSYGKLGNAPSVFSGGTGGRTTYIKSTPITTFAGGTNWKQVSCGGEHIVALKTDGTLWTWGYNRGGRLGNNTTTNVSTPITTFAGGTNWKQVSGGWDHTAAIKTDGTLWTWGYNFAGKLGNTVITNTFAPTPITTFAGGTDWKQVSVGNQYTAAIKTDGTLWTWGRNQSFITFTGVLGINDTTDRSTPVTTFAGGTNWKQVSAGNDHIAAVKTDGTLWTWGSGGKGQLGTNDTIPTRLTPVTTFAGGTNWKQVSAGDNHTLALRDDGVNKQLYIFGTGSLGIQLSNNFTPATTFAGGTNWKQVYMDQGGSAIKTDGTLWTWGKNSTGQLGTGDRTDRSTPVTTFVGGTDWKYTELGIALKTDGTLWTWGRQTSGDLARSYFLYRPTPVTTFAGGNNWADAFDSSTERLYTISGGNSHTAVIKTDGTLWTWGYNGTIGTLGNANSIRTSTPVTTFAGGTNWKQVSCSSFSTAAIKTDGTLWTWGFGDNGRLGNASTTNRSTPVTTFAGGTNWKQVSCGYSTVAAIKTDGTLWTWGSGGGGTLGNNNSLSRSTPVTTFAGGTDWKNINVGAAHVMAIKTDGTLWVWGSTSDGKLGNGITTGSVLTPVTTFTGGTNWIQCDGGSEGTAAVKSDGTLWTWGRNANGQLGNGSTIITISTPVTTFAGGTNWRQVASGYRHTVAVKTDGSLWVWGNGYNGQLGNATTNPNISTPITTFAGGTDWKQVNSGYRYHVFAIKGSTGSEQLFVWGNNNYGQLGNATTTNVSTPVTTFAGGTNWANTLPSTNPEDLYTLSAGRLHVAAIKTDGTLWTWGNGQFGLGTAATSNTINGISSPVTTFAGGTNWKQVSSNYNYTTAIKTDGTLWTWGDNGAIQLGTNDTTRRSTPVTTFAGGTDWKQVSAGFNHAAAVKTDGTLWTWGSSYTGRLGNFLPIGFISTPITTFAGGTNWKQVSCGGYHTAAIKTDGTLWTWGSSYDGKLGNGVMSGNRATPVTTFAGGTDWKQVEGGATHTVAIKTDGTLWTWGKNNTGQLGTNDTTVRSTPITTFAGGTNWKQVSAGNQHTAAIKTDGTLWTWGNGYPGRLGNNDTSFPTPNRLTPVTTFAGGTNWKQVSCGQDHTMALKDDGVNKQLWLFGSNSGSQLGLFNDERNIPFTTFVGGTDWKSIDYRSAIKTDGTLWTWGGTRSIPATLYGGNNWAQVKQMQSKSNSIALKTDGTLWIWGFSETAYSKIMVYENAIPKTTFAGGTNWKQVSTGYDYTTAIKTDGTLWTWGNSGHHLGIADISSTMYTPVTTFAGGNNWKQVVANEWWNAILALKSEEF